MEVEAEQSAGRVEIEVGTEQRCRWSRGIAEAKVEQRQRQSGGGEG